jgi:hypothetical protein
VESDFETRVAPSILVPGHVSYQVNVSQFVRHQDLPSTLETCDSLLLCEISIKVDIVLYLNVFYNKSEAESSEHVTLQALEYLTSSIRHLRG